MRENSSDVITAQGLVSALSAFSEDDLIRYDRQSRKDICDEIKRLCKEEGADVPSWVKNLEKNQSRYDSQAEMRGLTPTSLLDELNFEVDGDFKSFHSYGRWLAALDEADKQVDRAKALLEPEDDEMKSFLEDAEKGSNE
jgi:hypothetical protein